MKATLAIIATIIAIVAFLPYLKDIFLRKTKPHAYTWLIWAITQGTAVVGIWYGGGGWGALNLTVGLFFVVGIFFFSLKYGTRNITKSDTLVLAAALLAIVVWWQLKQPLLAVCMVSAIDFLGYIPSFRKSYHEPWDETLLSWLLFSLSNVFSILALTEYGLLTTIYLITISVANLIIFSICFFRRRVTSKPLME